MHHRSGWLGLAMAAGCILLLAGCYEEPIATVYEQGVYKGSPDPLLDKLEGEELQAQLEQRFARVQKYQ